MNLEVSRKINVFTIKPACTDKTCGYTNNNLNSSSGVWHHSEESWDACMIRRSEVARSKRSCQLSE